MKKIIQRTRRFEKSFGKLDVKTQKLFIKKLAIFIDDEYAASLRTHRLNGYFLVAPRGIGPLFSP